MAVPKTPQYPPGMIAPPGQTAPFNPQWQSFLPSDPTAMATGLTPEMLAGIQRPPMMAPPPAMGPPMPPPAAAPQPAMGPQGGGMQQRDLLARLMQQRLAAGHR